MNHLYYLSKSSLLIRVEYVLTGNSLRYTSHREMEQSERADAEQYIMLEVAPKTEYFSKTPSEFVYLGTDKRLKQALAWVPEREPWRSRSVSVGIQDEHDINEAVSGLINKSMEAYYSEKIGELILRVRRELKAGKKDRLLLENLKQQLKDLVAAYNAYAVRKVSPQDVIPAELKSHWPGLEELLLH